MTKRTQEEKSDSLDRIVRESKGSIIPVYYAWKWKKDLDGKPLTNAMSRILGKVLKLYLLYEGISSDSDMENKLSFSEIEALEKISIASTVPPDSIPTTVDRVLREYPYRIPLSSINPWHERELERTIYILGSPGAGKGFLARRLETLYNGYLSPEAGVFDHFMKYVEIYLNEKPGELIGNDFFMPTIDNFALPNSGMRLGKFEGYSIDHPYSQIYLGGISYEVRGGGRSAFPDMLFIPSEKTYSQVVVFPGHFRIDDMLKNKSIPYITKPDEVVYLIDPKIMDFTKNEEPYNWIHNNPLARIHISMADIKKLEREGHPVITMMSKTSPEDLGQALDNLLAFYHSSDIQQLIQNSSDDIEIKCSGKDISAFVKRIKGVSLCTDSMNSSDEYIRRVFDPIIFG
ncbi:MAG: hypothetical protein ABIJ34_08440 [archaeon]